MISRAIRNAYRLKDKYYKERSKLGETWTDVQANKIPDDPTILFLGEHWWKLPATMSAAMAIALALAQMFGLSSITPG